MIFSIITTTYNHGKYIRECIESVLAQSFQDWEMIIIDDGSKDETGTICKSYESKDRRIRYFYQENQGLLHLGNTYNKALAHAKGKYIAILEGDDYWSAEKLDAANKALDASEAILYWAKTEVVDEAGKVYTSIPVREPSNLGYFENNPPGAAIGAIMEFFPAPLTWVIKKEALLTIGGFASYEGMPTTDLPTILKLLPLGTFIYDKKSRTFYRRHLTQATRNHGAVLAERAQQCIVEFLEKSPKSFIEQLPYSAVKIKRHLDDNRLINYSMHARALLINKDWKQARKFFSKTITGSGSLLFSWRLKSLLGYLFSFLKMDLEGLASFFGKKTYT